jgi:hypothetical protein
MFLTIGSLHPNQLQSLFFSTLFLWKWPLSKLYSLSYCQNHNNCLLTPFSNFMWRFFPWTSIGLFVCGDNHKFYVLLNNKLKNGKMWGHFLPPWFYLSCLLDWFLIPCFAQGGNFVYWKLFFPFNLLLGLFRF